ASLAAGVRGATVLHFARPDREEVRMRALVASLLMLVPFESTAGGAESFACNRNALTRTERTDQETLSRALFASVRERRELPDGYAFRLPGAALVDAARWVSLERRCCPFFALELNQASHDGPLWLRVTGAAGIKPFLRAEFQLDS